MKKSYIETSVLEEAKKRIAEIYTKFDFVTVSFSGGKDSLVVLELVKQFFIETKRKDKIHVIFYDEELIPQNVIDFVNKKAKDPMFNFHYIATEMESEKYIMGKKVEYIQWDKERKHIRKKPENAISFDYRVSQYDISKEMMKKYGQNIYMGINGMRADESLTRLRGCLRSRFPHIQNTGGNKNIFSGKVIYDWTEFDIFKFIKENNLEYAEQYDLQYFNNEALRVSTPLHAEASKRLDQVRTRDPKFYDQLLEIFPEIDVQARYYKDYDRKTFIKKYEKTEAGLIQMIKDLTKENPKTYRLAFTRLAELKRCSKWSNDWIQHRKQIFQVFLNGAYKRNIVIDRTRKEC